MKSIDEMCAVMQAFKEGKTIEELYDRDTEWKVVETPLWNFHNYQYRVKPEPKYVPYDSVSEVERNKWVRKKDGPNVLRVISAINTYTNEVYVTVYRWCTIKEFFEEFEYEDGTPCGKLVET